MSEKHTGTSSRTQIRKKNCSRCGKKGTRYDILTFQYRKICLISVAAVLITSSLYLVFEKSKQSVTSTTKKITSASPPHYVAEVLVTCLREINMKFFLLRILHEAQSRDALGP
jgi:hypothetical protein